MSEPRYITLDDTPTIALPPAERLRCLSHAVVYNPTAAAVYLIVGDSAATDGSNPVARDPIPIGPGFSGTIELGLMVGAAASITATTSSDGTGAPSSDVEASLHWERTR